MKEDKADSRSEESTTTAEATSTRDLPEFPVSVVEDHSDAPKRVSESMPPEEWGPAL